MTSDILRGRRLNVLILEDVENDAWLVVDELKRHGLRLTWRRVDTGPTFQQALAGEPWDLIIADYDLPSFSAPRALLLFQQLDLDIPFLVVSGVVGEETAVEMVRQGADDYVMKDNLIRLGPAVERELKRFEQRRQLEASRLALQAERSKALERFESLAAHIPDCFWVEQVGTNGAASMAYVSPGWERIWGYSAEELYQQPDLWIRAVVNEDREIVTRIHRQAIATNERMQVDFRIHTKGGATRWIENTIAPVADESRRVVRLEGIARDTTERKQAEDSLRRQSELLEEAQQMAHLGNWEWDLRTNQWIWSDELCRICGLDPKSDEITAGRFVEILHPDDREIVRRNRLPSLHTGETLTYDGRIRRADGRERILHSRRYLIRDEQGHATKMRGICLDVTEQRQEETRFRSLLEAAPDAMVIVDERGALVLINKQTELLFGYDREELLGHTVERLLPESLRSGHIKLREHYFHAPSFRPMGSGLELRGLRKDGSEFPVEISLSPLNTPSGLLFTAAVRDVTERRKAENELRRSRVLLNEALAVTRTGGWEWHIASGEVWWSDQLYAMFGRDPKKFTPTLAGLLEMVVPEDREVIQNRIRATLDGDEPYEVRFRAKLADGSVVYHAVHGKLQRDSTGQPLRMLGVDRDVTEQHQVELRLRRTERLASLGTLAAGIAHEINNPISAAWTAAETAKAVRNRPDAADMVDEALDAISSAVQRCQAIIQNVLRFSRQESSSKILRDVNGVVRSAIETTRHFVDYRGSTLDAEYAVGLPHVTINGSEIEQVIVNLIRNAIESAERATVRVRTGCTPDVVFIEVCDNGRGIAAEHLERIFDPFFTHHETSEGTGLGLTISHGIVEDHGGSIEVQSNTGGLGTKFIVKLPRQVTGPHRIKQASTSP